MDFVFNYVAILQIVMANEQAIGWSGALKASIPDATASIQAKVVGPLRVEPLKVCLHVVSFALNIHFVYLVHNKNHFMCQITKYFLVIVS